MTYKYLTQEVIDSGGRNITSPEMFAEARLYNIEAMKNSVKRRRVHALFNTWVITQYVLVIWFMFSLITVYSNDYVANWRIILAALGFLGYLILVTYFIYMKNCRERYVLCLVSLPAILISFIFLLFPAANFGMGWYYNNEENKLSKELGYPSFPRLLITTVNSDADSITNLTYDSIREKANRDHPHDGTFL
ncbi:hypothetical protein SAMN02910265_02622 [Ruminococcus flavefaciens]|uniref:Uncharacterized protein n=1 Tax=Ruminococcus flavefaciens TaxID=1265 RepID=A0A1H6KPX4_RUMFL|nr:hypothetical protein [Ruminococcus flavefaciens]SEH77493.1 hypothetical protein SAMN02910265_02622 [Ruminococcus flavefaciens]